MPEIKPIQIDAGGQKIFTSNFSELRQHGIDLLQLLTGDTWTDYNLHDPGVTIFELLCFAITDLSYRTEFPLTDILGLREGKDKMLENAFFPAEQILTTNPVTVADFRKIILDETDNISNVWIEPVISTYGNGAMKGLYKIYAQVNEETAKTISTDTAVQEKIKEQVKKCFVAKRNLCEDSLREVILMKPVAVEIDAEIEIHEQFLPEEVLATIYEKLGAYFNAPVRIYTEKEMRQQGLSELDIYSGPLLTKGFILDSDLKPPIRQIVPMDLIEIITAIEGVLLVKNLTVTADGKTSDKTPLPVDEYSAPYFTKELGSSRFTFYKNKYQITIRTNLLKDILQQFKQKRMREYFAGAIPIEVTDQLTAPQAIGLTRITDPRNTLARSQIELTNDQMKSGAEKLSAERNSDPGYPAELGVLALAVAGEEPLRPGDIDEDAGSQRTSGRSHTNIAIEQYYSIQDHFPLIYGIGREGLPSNDRVKEGKARQLKGYLLLFEQIMANYLSQLANIHGLFSTRLDANDPRTYYYQPLYDIPNIAPLLQAFTRSGKQWEDFRKDPNNDYIQSLRQTVETDEVYRHRKNDVFSHLLARFNITLDEFPVTLYTQLYGERHGDGKISNVLKWKAWVTRHVVELSHDRTKAFDYTITSIGDRMTTGFEKRIRSILYMPLVEKRSLTAAFEGKELFMTPSRPKAEPEVSLSGDRPGGGSAPERSQPGGDTQLENGFVLKRQTIDLFRFGIDRGNYRIEALNGRKKGFVLQYKEPDAKDWIPIAHRPDRSSIHKALKELTDMLKKISIESEGCYLTEHVLLRPTLTDPYFGFGLYKSENYRVAQHKHWSSFDGREDTIKRLLATAGKPDVPIRKTFDDIASQCQVEKGVSQVLKTLTAFSAKGANLFFPRFEMFTRRFGYSLINEDFFNFRLTVALPAWPARFQNKNFRVFTEDIFRIHSPTHLRIQFLWMGISEMRRFEKVYFDWRDLLVSRGGDLGSCMESEQLIDLIADKSFTIS